VEAARVYAVLEEDGQVSIEGLPFKKGQRVEVIILAEEYAARRGKGMTAKDLLESPLVGMWKDRTDIGNSAEFARKLREEAQNRTRGRAEP
jgi:hypothetical protein